MQSDPFYRAIRDGLERKAEFSGDQFEACVCDLLKAVYPTLAPIAGGKDGGMDGAIADGEGEPYLLISTIQDRVIANLEKSLDSYVKKGGARRKAIVATSVRLTPQKRLDLQEKAREKGFTLVQTYEQRAVATLLYRSSAWCKELLRLDGHPPVLSAIPPNIRRPLVDVTLRGREADLEWLQSTKGDRLVVGEPGAGKTYLLYRLATGEEPWGLFLTTDDERSISNALRDQRPSVVVVDDAHIRVDLLERLRALRHGAARPFDIVAATWPDGVPHVQEALGVASSRVRKLELLTRREILELYGELGVDAADLGLDGQRILGSLVDQAANRPGLAVTLATLWLEGDYRPLLQGKALHRHWLATLKRLLDEDEEDLLATISLAGRAGVDVSSLSCKLGSDVRRRMASLSAAGVLQSRGDGFWAVQPQMLRSALLSEVFFSAERPSRNFRDEMDIVSSPAEIAWELIAAAYAGAQVPREELQALLLELRQDHDRLGGLRPDAWSLYAGVGKPEAEWALQNGPAGSMGVPVAALEHAPESAVPALLELALKEQSRHGSYHGPAALKALKDWLHEVVKPAEESVRRRRLLLRLVRAWADTPERLEIGFRAACTALTPRLDSRVDGADRESIHFRLGVLPKSQMRKMGAFVEDFVHWIHEVGVPSWSALEEGLWGWVYPQSFKGPVEQEMLQEAHRIARKVLTDMAPAIGHSPGLKAASYRLGAKLKEPVAVELDPIFEILYPAPNEDGEVSPGGQETGLETLAQKQAEKEPSEVVENLLHYHRESVLIGYRREGNTPRLLSKLVSRMPSFAKTYYRLLLDGKAPASWMDALLQATDLGRSESVLSELLSLEAYQRVGLKSALMADKATTGLNPQDLLVAVEEAPSLMAGPLREGKKPVQLLWLFLSAEQPEAAVETAYYLDRFAPEGQCPPELMEDWRRAVLRFGSREMTGERKPWSNSSKGHLRYLLTRDSGLALEWLKRHGTRGGRELRLPGSSIEQIIDALEEGQRLELLDLLDARSPLARRYLSKLVGSSPALLNARWQGDLPEDVKYQAIPSPDPDGPWPAMVEKALELGFSPEKIGALLPASKGGAVRSMSAFWQRWLVALDGFADSSGHPAASEVVHFAKQEVQRQAGIVQGWTRQADLHGATSFGR